MSVPCASRGVRLNRQSAQAKPFGRSLATLRRRSRDDRRAELPSSKSRPMSVMPWGRGGGGEFWQWVFWDRGASRCVLRYVDEAGASVSEGWPVKW